jgi:hypothetical protein
MTDEHMADLTIKPLVDGGFELWQQSGIDEAGVIQLHPAQIRLLAERAGLLPAPDPKLLDRMSAAHIRRLRVLKDRIDELDDSYRDEILDRCAYGLEICLHLRAISDLADELVAGLGIADSAQSEGEKKGNDAGVPETLPADQLTLT